MSNKFKFLQKVWFKSLPAIIWNVSENEIEILVLVILDGNAYWFNSLVNSSELTIREQEFSEELYEIRKNIL